KEDQTPHAISYLDKAGPARWFDGSGLEDNCKFEEEFIPAFKAEYVPHNFSSMCRKALTNLQMTTDFPSYLATFKEYLLALLASATDQSAADTIHEFAQTSFIDNCPRSLRAMIEAELVKSPRLTLTEIFSFADQMDKVYSIQPDLKSGKSNISPVIGAPFISFPKPSDPNPMAMDLDNIQVQFNNLNRRLDHFSHSFNNNRFYDRSRNNNNNNNPPRHPPRLTDNERLHLDNIGGCYRCRQPGHMGPDCPIYGDNNRGNSNTNQNNNYNNNRGNSNNNNNNNRNNRHHNNNNQQGGRWVYHAAVGESSELGKASDDQ
ncbi:hypothetical protein FBU30_003098, partial [Linnemannia zychae]